MRIALTVALAAQAVLSVGLGFASPATAEPTGSCPPACNRIPSSAWITPSAIPLNARYDWPSLAGLSVTSRAPRFRFEELCGSAPAAQAIGAEDPRNYAVAERSVITHPDGQWQLQAQIVHWRGETWRGGELAHDALAAAVSSLRACQLTNPGASPSITLDQPERLAAVISGPVILHEYLLADPVSSTVTELALWAAAPPAAPYQSVSDAAVLDAMGAPLCTAYLGSCQ